MKSSEVQIVPFSADDREQFIIDNQWSFKYGAMVEFGLRDDHVGDDGEIISRDTIEQCLDEPGHVAYRILCNGKKAGGAILKINKETGHNHLELFFVLPDEHSKGIGFQAWKALEQKYPETKIWETCTPYFEKRNVHFYVNKCGFHIVEFFNEFHADPEMPLEENLSEEGSDEMFRLIKVMK